MFAEFCQNSKKTRLLRHPNGRTPKTPLELFLCQVHVCFFCTRDTVGCCERMKHLVGPRNLKYALGPFCLGSRPVPPEISHGRGNHGTHPPKDDTSQVSETECLRSLVGSSVQRKLLQNPMHFPEGAPARAPARKPLPELREVMAYTRARGKIKNVICFVGFCQS